MWEPLQSVLARLEGSRFVWKVKRALALHTRSEARSDGLSLVRMCNRLEIQWRARGLHPWDRRLPPGDQETAFEEQLLEDTEAAITRLFRALPQVDVIDLSVLDQTTDDVLMSGTVCRSTLLQTRSPQSVRMRLRQLGINLSFSSYSL